MSNEPVANGHAELLGRAFLTSLLSTLAEGRGGSPVGGSEGVEIPPPTGGRGSLPGARRRWGEGGGVGKDIASLVVDARVDVDEMQRWREVTGRITRLLLRVSGRIFSKTSNIHCNCILQF